MAKLLLLLLVLLEENYGLLFTLCCAEHKWAALEIVWSLFRGCGYEGELIRW